MTFEKLQVGEKDAGQNQPKKREINGPSLTTVTHCDKGRRPTFTRLSARRKRR